MVGQIEQDGVLSSLYSQICAINIRAILPFLIEQNLITPDEREYLMNALHLDADKINKLMMSLPKKGPDALDKFILCLDDSSDGTGHDALAKRIRKAIYELKMIPIRKRLGKYMTLSSL